MFDFDHSFREDGAREMAGETFEVVFVSLGGHDSTSPMGCHRVFLILPHEGCHSDGEHAVGS